MHHYPEDVARLFCAVPCLRLAKPAGALRHLKLVVETGDELRTILGQYPAVRYEPLDFHYLCLQSLGALNEGLLRDLAEHYSWPGVIWAALLVALHPVPEFAPILESARARAPHQAWLIDLVLGMLSGTDSGDFPEHQAVLSALRTQLHAVVRPTPTLRLLPPLPDLQQHAQRVRAEYQRAGADAALREVRRGESDCR